MQFKKHSGRNFSKFGTFHTAEFYAEIESEADIAAAFASAHKLGIKPFVLGGGSNVFFKHSKIKSALLKNALPKKIEQLDTNLFRVSSSVDMLELLDFAYKNSRNSCYYLASAPCQLGGAIAMNAGGGRAEGKSISDFVVSVRYFDGTKIVEKQKPDIFFDYRNSEFSDGEKFVVSAVLELPPAKFAENPIRARLEWAAKNQDLSKRNCGSMCNRYYAPILKFTRLLFARAPAGISSKKLNWAVNSSTNPAWLRAVFATIKTLHACLGKRLKFEIKMVD